MKGVILAGGKASRLRPSTIVMGKALLPIYNKPMIFYSVSLLIESGIDEIYIVCSPRDKKFYDELFKDYKGDYEPIEIDWGETKGGEIW